MVSKPKPKLTVKCDDEQLERWKEAAYIRRTSLSDWVRKVLDATAQKTIGGSSTSE